MNTDLMAFIDSLGPLAVDLERELCRRPAVSPASGGEGELAKCLFLEEWLRGQGISALERYDAPDDRARGGVRPNLIATLPGGDEGLPRLWIMSHLDVVPPGDAALWRSDPWTLVEREGRVIGRGVEDNQQGLVSSALAAVALARRGVTPRRVVKLLFVADEENGSEYGVGWLLKQHPGLFRPTDEALIPDGGDREGVSIEVAEKNLLWARFTVHGAQAHGSMPDRGVNAHLAGAALALALHRELSAAFADRDPLFDPDYSTFQPTKKEANVPNINTIPGEDVFYYDMRVLPRYPLDRVLAEADRIQGGIAEAYGVRVSREIVQRMESRATAAEASLVGRLAGAVEAVYGVKTRPVGIGGGTVAAPLRNRGMDCAVWCRIEENAHQPNESALVANILGDAKVMALLMSA